MESSDAFSASRFTFIWNSRGMFEVPTVELKDDDRACFVMSVPVAFEELRLVFNVTSLKSSELLGWATGSVNSNW